MNLSRRRSLGGILLAMVFFSASFPLTAGRSEAAPSYPYPWPDNSVVPVFFVPKDWNVNSAEVQQEAAAIRQILPEVRQFYGNNNGGKTFRLNDLRVVQANGPKENYGITWNGRNIYQDGIAISDGFEGALVSELSQKGFPTPPAQNQSGYSTLIFAKGAGGYAGSRAFSTPQKGGWSILGDWAIDSIQGQIPEGAYWWSGKRQQTGAVAHELGHSFDLPHPEAYGWPSSSTVMGAWWGYPTVGLNDVDRQRLRDLRSEFFTSTVPPPTPVSVTATAVSGTSIRVSWADNSNSETGFRISNGVTSTTVGANTTSYTWSGLTQGRYMCFALSAYNAAGSSPYTQWACTSTPTVPNIPTNIKATPVNQTSIRVTWTDNSNNETGFELYNGSGTSGYFRVGANATTFTQSGLSPGKYMCFSAKSFNLAGLSAATPYACTTTPR